MYTKPARKIDATVPTVILLVLVTAVVLTLSISDSFFGTKTSTVQLNKPPMLYIEGEVLQPDTHKAATDTPEKTPKTGNSPYPTTATPTPKTTTATTAPSGGGGGGGSSGGGTTPPQTTPTPIQTGDTVVASISISGGKDISGGQYSIDYDKSTLRLDTIKQGTYLEAGDPQAVIILADVSASQNGEIKDLVLFRIKQPGVNGAGTMAVITFTALKNGQPNIQITDAILSDSNAQQTSGSSTLKITIQ